LLLKSLRLFGSYQLFLFERKSRKKNQKSLQDLSALSAQIKAFARTSPRRDFCSFLAKIGRNREVIERFTNFLWSANAL